MKIIFSEIKNIDIRKGILFVLIGGILCGLLMTVGYLLVYLIGLWAIYTNFIFFAFINVFIIKVFKFVFDRIINIISALILGFPLFLIGLAVLQLISETSSTISYTNHGIRKLIGEWFEYTTILTLVLALLFVPINHMIIWYKKKRSGI